MKFPWFMILMTKCKALKSCWARQVSKVEVASDRVIIRSFQVQSLTDGLVFDNNYLCHTITALTETLHPFQLTKESTK